MGVESYHLTCLLEMAASLNPRIPQSRTTSPFRTYGEKWGRPSSLPCAVTLSPFLLLPQGAGKKRTPNLPLHRGGTRVGERSVHAMLMQGTKST